MIRTLNSLAWFSGGPFTTLDFIVRVVVSSKLIFLQRKLENLFKDLTELVNNSPCGKLPRKPPGNYPQ
jgi:hypothetical protein